MAENSRYYWIKLRTDFFNQETIDFLMSQKNGCEYIVLYQMLCLKTANTDGQLLTKIGEMIVPYDISKIVRDTKYFDFDTVTVALELFKKLGLIFESDDNVLTIAGYDNMIGSETIFAEKKRQYRKKIGQSKQQLLTVDNVSDNVSDNKKDNVSDNFRQENRDKRLEIRDKILDYREEEDYNTRARVNPSPPSPLEQLIYDYGKENVDCYIQRVNNWHRKHNKPLNDLEGTVRRWMTEDDIQKIDHSVDKYKALINKF